MLQNPSTNRLQKLGTRHQGQLMARKHTTKRGSAAAQRHMGRVAQLPCLACGVSGVQVHHIREGQGGSQRAPDFLTVPLCPDCHKGGFSIHKSPKAFTNIYGSELDMLAQTLEQIEKQRG